MAKPNPETLKEQARRLRRRLAEQAEGLDPAERRRLKRRIRRLLRKRRRLLALQAKREGRSSQAPAAGSS